MGKYILGLIFLFLPFISEAKVLIMTHAYNRPDFIEIQCRTFQKFLQDEYEFVVFNDAPEGFLHQAIVAVCKKWDVPCITIPQEIHERFYTQEELIWNVNGRRHGNGIRYSLEVMGFDHDGIVAILDSDLFLIRPFSFEKILEGYEIAAVMRHKDKTVHYLWPGLTILAMDRLPHKETLNFNNGMVCGKYVDTGGHTYDYITNNPTLRLKELNELFSAQLFCPDRLGLRGWIKPAQADNKTPIDEQVSRLRELGFNENEIAFLQKKPDTINFVCDHHFLHYRAASCWDKSTEEYNRIKTALIDEFIENLLR